MAAIGILLVLAMFALTVAGGVLLYVLVSSEHDRRTATDRDAAERIARRDRADDEADDAVEGNHWG